MKKVLIIIVLLLGLFLIPNVYAEELPREGVTYFMTYPNNEEVVTESYDEAVSEPERLIFEGVTDNNGQLRISGLGNQGEIRITGNGEEIKVNLTNQRTAEIKEKNLVNPKTGASLIFIIALVAGLTLVTIKTKKKKALLVVPVIFAITLLSNVKAESDDFVVTIKNSQNHPLSGKVVKVYAKPIKVEGIPAIKYNANGGQFFDGSTLMYAKIPNNGCSWNDMWDYVYNLDEEYGYYIDDNTYYAYRDGYYPTGYDDVSSLTNGMVVNIQWESSNTTLYTYYLNGGYIDFYGKKVYEVNYYENKMPNINISAPQKNGYYFIGYSNNNSCSAYNSYGVISELTELSLPPTKQYACWHEKPDGIYVNDAVAVGNYDNCFDGVPNGVGDDGFGIVLTSPDYAFDFSINNIYGNTPFISTYKYLLKPLPISTRSVDEELDAGSYMVTVNKVEIVYHGETIVSLDSNDIRIQNVNTCYQSYCRSEHYEDVPVITNSEKLSAIRNYHNNFYNSCQRGPVK